WVVRYLPIDVSDLCESLPEYANEDKTYEDFKKAIIALYPGAGEDRKFAVADVENLVAKRAAVPIANISELSAYYRDFFSMTSYLMKHNRLSESEQSRLFVRGIAPPLRDQVSQRLQLKLPDHYPDDPYKLDEIYDATKFVLHGTQPTAVEAGRGAPGSEGREGVVKVEEIAPLLRFLAQSVGEGSANANASGNTNPFAGNRYHAGAPPANRYGGGANNPFRAQPRAAAQAPPASREHVDEPSRFAPAGGRSEQAKRPGQDATVETAKKTAPTKEGPPRPPTPVRAPLPEQAAEHPFAKAKDTTYAPLRARNFGAPPAKPKDGEREAVYRTQAPVHDVKFAEEIFARSMKTPVITLSPEELLSIAPEVRAKYREAVTPRRVPNVRSVSFASIEEVTDEDNGASAEHFLASVSCSGEPLEPGAYVLPDPYEVYLRDVAADREPSPLTVAKESYALRSIVGLVDNKEYVEAIIDPGCMVIAMSENVCHALGMWYDPSVQLRMISANGEVDSSLGLVRNVPFCVADIVLYLQVHVIRHAAYDMLLGRPFDVLTKSVVKNF
ncbi:hypothetical protein BV20DRAFT_903556, partial [Pilatotrama ljubarskyi]